MDSMFSLRTKALGQSSSSTLSVASNNAMPSSISTSWSAGIDQDLLGNFIVGVGGGGGGGEVGVAQQATLLHNRYKNYLIIIFTLILQKPI